MRGAPNLDQEFPTGVSFYDWLGQVTNIRITVKDVDVSLWIPMLLSPGGRPGWLASQMTDASDPSAPHSSTQSRNVDGYASERISNIPHSARERLVESGLQEFCAVAQSLRTHITDNLEGHSSKRDNPRDDCEDDVQVYPKPITYFGWRTLQKQLFFKKKSWSRSRQLVSKSRSIFGGIYTVVRSRWICLKAMLWIVST